MMKLKLMPIFLLLCLAPSALAQTDCPAIVSAALEAVDSACTETGRNQLCYGNITLDVTPHETVTDFHFEQPGDVVNIADVENLRLSSFSLDEAAWGVALMNVQAYLPGTLPGQNVTFLLFGDVAIEDTGTPIPEVPVTAVNSVNVRELPTTNDRVVASLNRAQVVAANGRLPDTSWIRVSMDDGLMGWVSADFLDGDLQSLMAIEAETEIFGPMQAFYFTTGINDAPCTGAPNSGILIQTPQGVGTVQFRVNNVQIELGSTVYLQAMPGDAMTISVIEGHATLTAFDETQVVPAGTASRVPLDANGLASGAPEYPVPYAYQSLRLLPVDIAVFTPVTVGRAIATRDIPAAIEALGGPVAIESVCQVTPALTTTTNFRSGPGSGYGVVDTMDADNPYTVIGQFVGTDGFVWWQVVQGIWVRSDLVTTRGNCDAVPVLAFAPPTPVASPVISGNVCIGEIQVRPGAIIEFFDVVPAFGVPGDAIISTFFAGGRVIFEGAGTVTHEGIMWYFTWEAEAGLYGVQVVHTPTIQVQPAWAQTPFGPGESWSHDICQIRAE